MRGLFFSLFIMFLLISLGGAQEEKEPRIAIASDGKTVEALVAPKAARSSYYLIFDESGELREVVDNPHKNVGSGAGPLAAEFLASKEVTLVVAGLFGAKMVAALDNKGIRRVELTGKVGDALEKALNPD
jgi:predicted Fe-Mo cluster-binding NifX family protein